MMTPLPYGVSISSPSFPTAGADTTPASRLVATSSNPNPRSSAAWMALVSWGREMWGNMGARNIAVSSSVCVREEEGTGGGGGDAPTREERSNGCSGAERRDRLRRNTRTQLNETTHTYTHTRTRTCVTPGEARTRLLRWIPRCKMTRQWSHIVGHRNPHNTAENGPLKSTNDHQKQQNLPQCWAGQG